MDSYLFKTESDELGYFQKGGDACIFFIDVQYFPIYEEISWDWWKKHQSQVTPDYTVEDPILEVISYLLSKHGERVASFKVKSFSKNNFEAGQYYPRMVKGNKDLYQYINENSFIDEVRAYNNIVDMLNELFKVIEPTQSNLVSYGHKIREVLILACTEVEYLLKQFLKDNGCKPQGSFYTTLDYAKALNPLKLNEYVIKLKMHPFLDSLSPFKNWSDKRGETTKSLLWYNAYNAVKHDRGGSFNSASLEAVINAVGAIHVLLEAQYGQEIFHKFYLDYESSFQTEKYPTWDVEDLQVPIIQCNFSGEKLIWNSKIKFFEN